MAITETAAASSAAAEAADAAVHGPELSMGTEHLTDAIADTTNYFVVFFEKLLEGLTWGNVLFQLCVIVVAVLAGLMCSKLVRSVVARHMPPHELKERFTQRMKRLALSVVNAIAFGLAAGSVTACCAYGAVMMGYQASSLDRLQLLLCLLTACNRFGTSAGNGGFEHHFTPHYEVDRRHVLDFGGSAVLRGPHAPR